jgi:hypothetical protein
MPYCPICKREFHDPVKDCPTDHAPLVSELPYQVVEGDNTTWVEIASVGTEEEANLLQGFLDAEGIAAQIENLQFKMEPTNFGMMGDIRIYVGTEDEAKAQSLLRDRDRAYNDLNDDEETLVTDEGPASIDETAKAEVEE